MIEPEPTKERMHKSETSPICAEEAVGINKRVKRIHDHVKIVVPCAIADIELPIPPDRSMQLGSYSGVFDDPLHAEASRRRFIFRGEVNTWPTYAISNDISKSTSLDTPTSSSIDSRYVSEHNEFEVCQTLFEGGTTTRSDNTAEKKMRNWKKRKMIKSGPKLSLIPHFSYGVRKSRVRSRYFLQPFAKLRSFLIAEMIDK
uniref:Uncharacterized protein n=1 Tax=Brassica oleracea var. oleracea TaxID=109376 RepID=A0A0D3CIW7_BRAOL